MNLTRATLGGVPLEVGDYSFTRYRGTEARAFNFTVPTDRVAKFEALAKGRASGQTYLTLQAGGSKEIRFSGLFVASVIRGKLTSTVVVYDRRLRLAQRVGDADFNISYGDGILQGTAATTVTSALKYIVNQIDVLKDGLASGAYTGIKDADLDTRLIAGLPLYQALQAVLELSGVDLTVTTQGFFDFVSRDDIDSGSLPTNLPWKERPLWADGPNIITSLIPKKVHNYYTVRQELTLTNGDVTATPDALYAELEQVYAVRGEYYTLSELLAEFNLTGAISDADIARTIMTDTFQGTGIEANGTVNRQEVIKSIKDGWRTLWRVTFPFGSLGARTEWVFGKFKLDDKGNTDGGVDPVPVDCKWVEFLNVVDIVGDEYIGSKTAINHEGNKAPFVAKWDNGPHNRVIRIGRKPLQDGNVAYPGALVRELEVVQVNTMEDEEGFQANMKNLKVIKAEDRKLARFKTDFSLSISMVATNRLPNNKKRWHEVKKTGDANGLTDYVELPVSATVLAYKNEGGGLLNSKQINDDAEQRTGLYLTQLSRRFEGPGVAEGVHDVKIKGAVNQVVYERSGAIIRTRVEAGNLASLAQRKRIAAKARAMQVVEEAGKVIA